MVQIKIGVDVFAIRSLNGGIGFYLFYLLDELIKLKKEWQFYLYSPPDTGEVEHFRKYANVRIRIVPNPMGAYCIWSQVPLSFFVWKDKVDFFWGTLQTLPFFKRKKMKTMISLYDFIYLLCPETASTIACWYLKIFCPYSLKKANAIMPISYATGDKLLQIYRLKYHTVIHPPIKPEILRKNEGEIIPVIAKHGLQYNDFIVTVGTIEPRKNFANLIKIYYQILQNHPLEKIMPLVIIGGGGWKNEEIRAKLFAAREKFPSHVKILGYVSDQELPYYLSGARSYLALSVYEGYGMPLAEARVCGTPVACMDFPEMKEAAENDGVFLKKETLEKDLEEIFLRKKEDKKEIKVSYSTNKESAVKIADLIDSLRS